MGTKFGKNANILDIEALFKTYSAGINTSRDSIVYDYAFDVLKDKVEKFMEDYNSEVSRWVRAGQPKNVDDFVNYDKVKWSRNLKRDLRSEHYLLFKLDNIRRAMYRPYTKKWLYFSDVIIDELGTNRTYFPQTVNETENIVIWLKVGTEWPMFALAINTISDYLPQGGSRCFPFYTYSEDGTNRRENITDWSLKQFQSKFGEQVTKWDIFHYIYGMLHHPQYRERYAENLKRDLPHIPLIATQSLFDCCVITGKALMDLHLNYEQEQEYKLAWLENADVPFSWRIDRMRLTPDKTAIVVNESLTLSGIPPASFQYRLGNRSALEWVIDQYQVSTDKRSGIVSDPNNLEDPEYIVRLLGKVITVSVKTVKLVDDLAERVKVEDWMSEEVSD
jgi:predicted helicase